MKGRTRSCGRPDQAKWPQREDAPHSWRVPAAKIIENDWSLAAGRYKPVTVETVNHDTPSKILGDLLKLEDEIRAKAGKLLENIA